MTDFFPYSPPSLTHSLDIGTCESNIIFHHVSNKNVSKGNTTSVIVFESICPRERERVKGLLGVSIGFRRRKKR